MLYDILRELRKRRARERNEGDAVAIAVVCAIRPLCTTHCVHSGTIRATVVEELLTVPTQREDVFVSCASTRVLDPARTKPSRRRFTART